MIVKHSVTLNGHRTSYSLEEEFYSALLVMAQERKEALASLIVRIDRERAADTNLSSALRLAVLDHLMRKISAFEVLSESDPVMGHAVSLIAPAADPEP